MTETSDHGKNQQTERIMDTEKRQLNTNLDGSTDDGVKQVDSKHVIRSKILNNSEPSEMDKEITRRKRGSSQKKRETVTEKLEEIPSTETKSSGENHTYPFTYAGCLVVKDGNEILPEWLAYHYTVLPLRQLIVAVDPLSMTRVEPLLEKYREKLGMNIEVWNANSAWYDGGYEQLKFKNFDPKNHTKEALYNVHVYRQTCFLTCCARVLQSNGYTNVAFLDYDEYYSYNPHYDGHADNQNHSIIPLPKYMGRQNETIAHWISSGSDPKFKQLENKACVSLPRITYTPDPSQWNNTRDSASVATSIEETSTPHHNLPSNFKASFFHTIDHHTYAKNSHMNGKVIANLTNSNGARSRNPHIPLDNCCTLIEGEDFYTAWKTKASLIVRHYLGSFETYTNLNPFKNSFLDYTQKVTTELSKGYEYDNDGRENKNEMEENSTTRTRTNSKGVDMMGQWVGEFINLVGNDVAWELTQGFREQAVSQDLEIKNRLKRGEVVEPAYDWVTPWTSLPKKIFNLPHILRVNNGNN